MVAVFNRFVVLIRARKVNMEAMEQKVKRCVELLSFLQGLDLFSTFKKFHLIFHKTVSVFYLCLPFIRARRVKKEKVD